MSNLWSVIIPESAEVTNLVANPSFETNTTGYYVSYGSIVESTNKSRRGYKSLAVTPTSSVYDGIRYLSVSLVSGITYTFSVDVYGANGIPYHIYFSHAVDGIQGTPTDFTGSAQWTRKSVTWLCDSTDSYRVCVTKNNSASTSNFYVDGLVCCALDHDPGYFDGDQPDCYWTGTPHASTSIRKAGSNQGGEQINFDDLGFHIEAEPGAGMAEVSPLTLPIGSLPGSMDAGEKIDQRTFSLVGTLIGTSQTDLHSKRQALIDAVKSDRVKNKQQVKLVYSGANSDRPVRITAKYTGGLTLNTKDGFSEKLALRFLATDPFWYEDGTESKSLTRYSSISDADYIVRRIGGVWYNVSTDFGNIIYAGEEHNGIVYLGGAFTNVGDANGDYIVSWNGSALASLGTGLAGGVCNGLRKSPSGLIYACGAFTSAGGVANTARIAYWDPVAADWNEVGGGIASGVVYAIAINYAGTLFAGGTFTNHVDANGDCISQFDGTNWSSLSTGMNGAVCDVKIGPDGYLYACGAFTTSGGVTTNYISKWDGSAWTALGGGLNSTAYSITFDERGNLYVAGTFTTAGDVSAAYVAMWNGSSWHALGTGMNNNAYKIVYKNGLIYAGGEFTGAGGLSVTDSFAVWNGSTWSPMPVDFPGTSVAWMILPVRDDLYIGGDFTGTANASYQNTLTNTGKAIAYPKFVFTQTGATWLRVAYIRNDTTGKTLWMNFDILDGDTLTIDTSPENRSIVSKYRGNVIGTAMLQNSDFADFYLLPGDNLISVFAYLYGSGTVVNYATWPITHWSLDGSAE